MSSPVSSSLPCSPSKAERQTPLTAAATDRAATEAAATISCQLANLLFRTMSSQQVSQKKTLSQTNGCNANKFRLAQGRLKQQRKAFFETYCSNETVFFQEEATTSKVLDFK